MNPDSSIEQYLDDLLRALAGRPPRELRALLAEAEAHLIEPDGPASRLAATIRDTVGFTAFALGAIGTLLLGVDSAVRGTGAGQWFTGAAVAIPAAGVFALLLLRNLRTGQT